MKTTDEKTLAMPEGLGELGKKAYEIIVDYLVEVKRTNTGGCDTFVAPDEWKKRGEEYGHGGVLIVVYDGGDVGAVFDYDKAYEHDCARFGHVDTDQYVPYEMLEEMSSRLGRFDLYFEPCTRWYGAVYVRDSARFAK